MSGYYRTLYNKDMMMRTKGRHKLVSIKLSRKQCQYVLDALDVYEDGLSEARVETADDNGFVSIHELLDVASGYSEDQKAIEDIRRKVHYVVRD